MLGEMTSVEVVEWKAYFHLKKLYAENKRAADDAAVFAQKNNR
jgi:hypothetical protein